MSTNPFDFGAESSESATRPPYPPAQLPRASLASSKLTWVLVWVFVCSAISFVGSNILASLVADNKIKDAGDIIWQAGGVIVFGFLAFMILVWYPLAQVPIGGGYHNVSPQEHRAQRAAILGVLYGYVIFSAIYLVLCHGSVLVMGLLSDSWHLPHWKQTIAWGGLLVGVVSGVFTAVRSRRLAEDVLAGKVSWSRRAKAGPMRRYKYEAMNVAGTAETGVLEAQNEDDAQEQLKKLGVFVTQLQEELS